MSTSVPLSGMRVVEVGRSEATMLAGALLADLGAEVVLVEDLEGHPLRPRAGKGRGHAARWKVAARNKRSVTMALDPGSVVDDLRMLIDNADMLIEDLGPGGMEALGIDLDAWTSRRPGRGAVRVSSYGGDGPYCERPGSSRTAEAISGVVHLTGETLGPPMHPSFSLASSLTGLMAATALVMTMLEGRRGASAGQVVDLALYDTLFRMIEWQLPAFDTAGVVPVRNGNRFPMAAGLGNIYETLDGSFVTISAVTPATVERLLALVGLESGQGTDRVAVDEALAAWARCRTLEVVLAQFEDSGVVGGRLFDADAIIDDEQYVARRRFVEVIDSELGALLMPTPLPPGDVDGAWEWAPAPELGADNSLLDEVRQSHAGVVAAPESPDGAQQTGGVLRGVRVLELGHVVAVPFCAGFMADHGADVVKVEAPNQGDAMRNMQPMHDGVSLWWKVIGRNRRCVTIDLRSQTGLNTMRELIAQADVLIENFAPGSLDRLGLSWDEIHAINPALVMFKCSGYGASVPCAGKRGFGKIAEAMSGVVALTGAEGGGPMHIGFSLADAVTGLAGVMAISAALLDVDRTGVGILIDLALFESLFRLIDWVLPVKSATGEAPRRAGNQLVSTLESDEHTAVVRTTDGWATVWTSNDLAAARLASLVGATSAGSQDADLASWAAARSAQQVLAEIAPLQGVCAEQILDAEAMCAHPQLRHRSIVQVPDPELGTMLMPAVVPVFSRSPGSIRHAGRVMGHDNDILLTPVVDPFANEPRYP